jgi:hypothetical protein
MKYVQRVLLAITCALACSPGAISQCTRGNVNIAGRIENFAGQTGQIGVTVLLKKGKVAETPVISGPDFSIDVPFSAFSSYFFLWGHRCNNSPLSVLVKITSGGITLAEEKLTIKDNFRIEAGGPSLCIKE